MIVQAVHTVETSTATVPLPIMILKEKIAGGTLPENVRCRMVLPGAEEEGTSTQRCFTLWEGNSVEEIKTEVLALLEEVCTSEFIEILDAHCFGLDKSEWVPMREKLNRRMSQMRATARSIDEKNGISEKTAALAESTREKAGKLYESTGETMKVVKEKSAPVVTSGLSSMRSGWSSMVTKVQEKTQKKDNSGGSLDLSTPTNTETDATSYGEAEGAGEAVLEGETLTAEDTASEAATPAPEPEAEQNVTDLDDIAPAVEPTEATEDTGYETVGTTEAAPELL